MPELAAPVLRPGALSCREQPCLAAGELLLRPWRLTDAEVVAQAYRDPEIQRWHVRSMTGAEALAWVGSRAALWAAESGAEWAITEHDVPLGRVRLRMLDLGDGEAEAGYWVLPAARGRNIAARALVAVSEWMFEQVGLHRIVLSHSTRNPASCRVASRAGYLLEGILRQQALHADGWHDMHLHARLNPDS